MGKQKQAARRKSSTPYYAWIFMVVDLHHVRDKTNKITSQTIAYTDISNQFELEVGLVKILEGFGAGDGCGADGARWRSGFVLLGTAVECC